ncbi:MAG: hypothetical protein JNL83_02825 [Myxococcales bacterium]|nr:hypothetical protein [Myxococcales bacterium]
MTVRIPLVIVLAASVARAGPTEGEMIDEITIHPRSERAEQYAILFIARINQTGTLDEVTGWVDRMLAMPRLLYGRPKLVSHLQNLQVRGRYQRARIAEAEATRAKDAVALHAACDAFLASAALARQHAPTSELRLTALADEATYNAGICYLAAGDPVAGLRHLSVVASDELAWLGWRRIVTTVVRAPYAWLIDRT